MLFNSGTVNGIRTKCLIQTENSNPGNNCLVQAMERGQSTRVDSNQVELGGRQVKQSIYCAE